MLGMKLSRQISQPLGTGVTLMVSTISHGTRTNISQSIVDHAGLKELPLHLLIDSTLCSIIPTQLQLDSMLKLLSTVKQEEIVKEEIQVVYGNMLTDMVSQIPHVNNT
jgi:hypothetical protein